MEKQQDLSAPTASFDAPALIARLPQRPGVYRMFDREGGLLYVGKAGNLKRRVSSYFQQRQLSPRIAHMVGKATTFCFVMTKPIPTCGLQTIASRGLHTTGAQRKRRDTFLAPSPAPGR
ncbi:MAG: hypothetical protein EBU09_02710 [Betaproteobacteria bacterium]|nr:hypothetical protein [Betaproteobacteria bacterium]